MIPLTAGRLRAPDLRARTPIMVTLTQDVVTRSNADNIEANGLSLILEADNAYAIDGYIAYSTDDIADLFITLLGPDRATGHNITFSIVDNGSTTGVGDIRAIRINAFNGFNGGDPGGAATTPDMACLMHGYILTVDGGGTFQLLFSQRVATAVNTIIRAGSWLRFTQLA